jgi:hypothetical protein
VSFIVTPAVDAGDAVNTYFSQDPFIVECFERVFEEIQNNAARQGRIFKVRSTAERFASQQSSNVRNSPSKAQISVR